MRATTCGKKEEGGLARPVSTAKSTESAAAQPFAASARKRGRRRGRWVAASVVNRSTV